MKPDVSVSNENTYVVLYAATDYPSTDDVVSIRFYEDKAFNWDLHINYIKGFESIFKDHRQNFNCYFFFFSIFCY